MNYAEYIIGLCLGVFIAIIVREFIDVRNENREALEKKEKQLDQLHDFVHSEIDGLKYKIKDITQRIIKDVERIEKLEQFKKDSELSLPIVADRIDQHAGRIEKLESKKR